jgi:hypothetical protein
MREAVMPREGNKGRGSLAKQSTGGLTRDRLEYVADLLLELQAIATEEGCETLAGLLALSRAEALRKT